MQSADADPTRVVAPSHHLFHTHPAKGAEGTKAHQPETQAFFHDLVRALEGTTALMVMGPSSAKNEFVKYLHEHSHALESCLEAVETTDHPTDPQVMAAARKHFARDNHVG